MSVRFLENVCFAKNTIAGGNIPQPCIPLYSVVSRYDATSTMWSSQLWIRMLFLTFFRLAKLKDVNKKRNVLTYVLLYMFGIKKLMKFFFSK